MTTSRGKPLPNPCRTRVTRGWDAAASGLGDAALLDARLAGAVAGISAADLHMDTLAPSDLGGGFEREVVIEHRRGSARASGRQFLRAFAIPHFFHHLTTAYGILRNQGVPLTMGDFLGDWGRALSGASPTPGDARTFLSPILGARRRAAPSLSSWGRSTPCSRSTRSRVRRRRMLLPRSVNRSARPSRASHRNRAADCRRQSLPVPSSTSPASPSRRHGFNAS
ncbi:MULTISPECIES: DUF1993 family protein [Myxococcus]|uniref:DUF1993 family protein n=1 Tax=Myxococcus TaxID=32 RepID=UPI001141AA83|nr:MULTISPECIES: DUF1993 family protein [Myxococcus]